MKHYYFCKAYLIILSLFLAPIFIPEGALAQQLRVAEFSIFAGAPTQSGGGVVLGSSTSVSGGSIGSYLTIQSTGTSSIGGNLHSGGTITLTNSNSVGGNITVANSAGFTGNSLLIGSSATISGNIDVNGNILIGGGSITGKVTHPVNTSYMGPTPLGGRFVAVPEIPVLPSMPLINDFTNAGTVLISNNKVISPGSYGKMALTGNKRVTFSGIGTYVF